MRKTLWLFAFLLLAAGVVVRQCRMHPAAKLVSAPASNRATFVAAAAPAARLLKVVSRKSTSMPTDTTAPVPLALSFSGTTGTLTWTEAGSPPVVANTALTVSGGGNSAMNGVYLRSSTADSNGNRYWVLSGSTPYYVSWNTSTGWWNTPNLDGSGQGYSISGTLAAGPVGGSTSPAGNPTLYPAPGPSIAGFGTNQGLTITGLSGGAVTVSAVSTSGTTTTFTTSRAIASTETGGTLYGAAGAFSDSASPPNPTAAFSIPITSAMFGSGGGGTTRRRTAQWL